MAAEIYRSQRSKQENMHYICMAALVALSCYMILFILADRPLSRFIIDATRTSIFNTCNAL